MFFSLDNPFKRALESICRYSTCLVSLLLAGQLLVQIFIKTFVNYIKERVLGYIFVLTLQATFIMVVNNVYNHKILARLGILCTLGQLHFL
jgi:hypothetical protein